MLNIKVPSTYLLTVIFGQQFQKRLGFYFVFNVLSSQYMNGGYHLYKI